jgi:excinuclease ABC subunit C
VIGDLQARMMAYADALEFEKAAEVRNQIGALSRVLHQQAVDESSLSSRDRDVDVLAVKVQGGRACVNLAMVRGGRHLGDRAYFPAHVETRQRRAGTMPRRGRRRAAPDGPSSRCWRPSSPSTTWAWHVPPLLVTSHRSTRAAGRAVRADGAARIARSTSRASSAASGWRWRCKGAELALARLLAEEGSQRERTRALVEALDLGVADLDTLRIECFDISHTAGEATQASCVVYEKHGMRNSEYRRFNIEGITGGDDYAAMRQVLTRR